MSEDVRYWKAAATSKISSFKGYLAQKDLRPHSPRFLMGELVAEGFASPRQTWGQWAGNKLKWNNQGQESNNRFAVERLSLFPGWAARRFHKQISDAEEAHFDVEVFVSGFASRVNHPEFLSRSQKAFLRLAKGFASLPKLKDSPIAIGNTNTTPFNFHSNQFVDELLTAEPSAEGSDEAAEVQFLEEYFRTSDYGSDTSQMSPHLVTQRDQSSSQSLPPSPDLHASESFPKPQSALIKGIHELHANLESRLQPFWATALSNRTVRISLYASREALSMGAAPPTDGEEYMDPSLQPLVTREVTTTQSGSFQVNLAIPWEALCTHPTGLYIAFGDEKSEHDLFVRAELLPALQRSTSQTSYRQTPVQSISPSSTQTPVFEITTSVPLTFAPVRVISDIDDTVKLSNVSSGARVAFTTVFVKRLSDTIIPGMAEWYTDMWRRGVRFHYVSNAPYEILPILHEFFQLVRLPSGSIKLRSYAGRSLFNGILSAPATRKRQGIIEILDSFPESQFLLIGDSGEQDLELYAALSAERSEQVLAVLIRDVRTRVGNEDPNPLEDPTGSRAALRRSSSASNPTYSRNNLRVPAIIRRTNSDTILQDVQGPAPGTPSGLIRPRLTNAQPSYPKNESWSGSQFTEEPEPQTPVDGNVQKLTELEWKRYDLQLRVDKARLKIPKHISFRVFRSPTECIEVSQLLDEMHRRSGRP